MRVRIYVFVAPWLRLFSVDFQSVRTDEYHRDAPDLTPIDRKAERINSLIR